MKDCWISTKAGLNSNRPYENIYKAKVLDKETSKDSTGVRLCANDSITAFEREEGGGHGKNRQITGKHDRIL